MENYYEIGFKLIEFCAFLLPVLPESLWVRLSIILVYFLGHMFHANVQYGKFKQDWINAVGSTSTDTEKGKGNIQ